MTPQETEAQVMDVVKTVLRDALEVPPEKIAPEARIIDDLGAESIDLLDIRFRLERSLGIRITNEDMVEAFRGTGSAEEFRKMFTVNAMCAYLTARLAATDE